jgi:hypothetical protein
MTDGLVLSVSKVKIRSYRNPANFPGKGKIFYEDEGGRPNNVKSGFPQHFP